MGVEPLAEPGEGSISRTVSTPSNTLVSLPDFHDHDVGVCLDLLTVASPADENVLAISFEETATDKACRWSEAIDLPPRELAVVEASPSDPAASAGPTRGRTGDSERTGATAPDPTRRVSDGGDLTSLAETIGGQLSEWEASDARTVVCFESLTALLERNGLRGAFRFLCLLGRRLESADAVAHFHLDPDAVDDRTLYTLFPLFGTVVEHDESGSIRLTSSRG